MEALTVIQFDLRRSPECPDSQEERYRACLDMVRWGDENGITVAGFSEHHNTEDGFLSSPMMLAMAAAQATSNIRLSVSALLLPLHDPIRIAEDIAVLDLVSQGRFMAVAGLGYREREYQTMGLEWQRRGRIMDEKLAVLLQAWRGEYFSHNGVPTILNPVPLRPAQALLCVGGNSAAAARRAARFGLYFAPAIDDPDLADAYNAACEEYGFGSGAVIFPNEPSLTLVSEDPERDWAHYGKYFLYDALAYGQWRHATRRAYAESFATDLAGLRTEGKYCFLSPDEAIARIRDKGSINLSPLCGGMPLEVAWNSLELFAGKVIPALSGGNTPEESEA